jgi:ubiquinone/menaquinone biosynthesis C-methylase UbiE
MEAEADQRDRESEKYDALLGLRLLSRWEIPATLAPLHLGPQSRLVEVGCGTGRFTTHLARTGAQVLALDHSLSSLRVLRGKLPENAGDRVQLVRAAATHIPVSAGWATHVLAAQVLEHIPGDRIRRQCVEALSRVLGAGGQVCVSAYRYWPGLRREGFHSDRIYFYRFRRHEFTHLLAPHFELKKVSGRLLYVWLAHGTRR